MSEPGEYSNLQTDSTDNDQWQMVRQALMHEKWDFRTVEGIARETGLANDLIEQLLDSRPDEVRKSPVHDKKGRVLYRLRTKSAPFQEILASVRAFVAKKA